MVSARMQSARQVGGDFYDSFLLKNGDVCVCIGDVSGKGIAAALFLKLTCSVFWFVGDE